MDLYIFVLMLIGFTCLTDGQELPPTNSNENANQPRLTLEKLLQGVEHTGFTSSDKGITGTLDSFTGPSDGFTGPSDGFTGPSDGSSGPIDGFMGPSDGFTESNQGFIGSSDGFAGPSDGFTSTSDGFAGPSDGFPSTSDSFSGPTDGLSDGFKSGSSANDMFSISSDNSFSDGSFHSGIVTSSDEFAPFNAGTSHSIFSPEIVHTTDFSDSNTDFMSMGTNPITSDGNSNLRQADPVVVVVRNEDDSNQGVGTFTSGSSSSSFSDGFGVGSSSRFNDFGTAGSNDGFVQSQTSIDNNDGFLNIDSGTMDGFLASGIDPTPGFGSNSRGDGRFSTNTASVQSFSTGSNARGPLSRPVVVEVRSSRFTPDVNKPIVVISTISPSETLRRFESPASQNRHFDRSRNTLDSWRGPTSGFTTEIPIRRPEPAVGRPLPSRRSTVRPPPRSTITIDSGMPPLGGSIFRSAPRRDFDRFGDSLNPREPFLPRTDSRSRFGSPLPLVSFGERPRITIGSMGAGSVGISDFSRPLRGRPSRTIRGSSTRFGRDFRPGSTSRSSTDVDTMPPFVARLLSGSPSAGPFSSSLSPSMPITPTPRSFGSLSSMPFSSGSLGFPSSISSFDSFGTSGNAFPSMSSSLFGPSPSVGMRSSLFTPSLGTTSLGGGFGSSGIFGGATSPFMGSFSSPFTGSTGFGFPSSLSTMRSFGSSLTSPLSFGAFSGGLGFPRSFGMPSSRLGLGF